MYKRQVPQVSGNVLEIGIGSGLNLPHYKASNISKITALDPAEELTDIAKRRISELDLYIDIMNCGADEIALKSKSFDFAILEKTKKILAIKTIQTKWSKDKRAINSFTSNKRDDTVLHKRSWGAWSR